MNVRSFTAWRAMRGAAIQSRLAYPTDAVDVACRLVARELILFVVDGRQ